MGRCEPFRSLIKDVLPARGHVLICSFALVVSGIALRRLAWLRLRNASDGDQIWLYDGWVLGRESPVCMPLGQFSTGGPFGIVVVLGK